MTTSLLSHRLTTPSGKPSDRRALLTGIVTSPPLTTSDQKDAMTALEIASERRYNSIISWNSLADQFGELTYRHRVAIVDKGANWFFDKSVKRFVTTEPMEIDPDERRKTQATVDKIHDFLFHLGIGRDDCVIALGGGIVCDIVGFAASTYKRGISWIAVPTTLLAQVDASVGGKTAINTKYGKNTIGAFHPPDRVIMSHRPSETWNDAIIKEGIAEIIKTFLLFDLDEVQNFAIDGLSAFADGMTKKTVAYKAEVVRIDPWESNLRAALNYGHTFGHAIEAATGQRHGIAVSQGIRIANRVAQLVGKMKRSRVLEIDAILDKLGFPKLDGLPPLDNLMPLIAQDKKNRGGEVMMVLVDGESPVPMKPVNPAQAVRLDTLTAAYGTAVQSCS